MTQASTRTDAADVEAVIAARNRAISAKDAAAVAACQAPGAVSFNLAPPLVADDVGGLQDWFDSWDGPIGLELRDLKVAASGDVAFAHALAHMTGRRTYGETSDVWFRLTLGLTRGPGGWKIVHEHESTPFYMDGSLKAAVDLKP
ncbi:MAG TPA: nuclear transport factor 2 family protein [Caulobacteraceae bacterium]|jgi:PhnB protein